MDARLAYWTWALVNMIIAVALAIEGARRIRRQELGLHKKLMLTSASLVGLFAASYVVKVPLLGKEPLATWSPNSILLLRLHETCILVMLVAGARAGVLAYQLRCVRIGEAPEGTREARRRRMHRRAGWTAVGASVLGAITAMFVLAGMYSRGRAPQPEREPSGPAVLGTSPPPAFDLLGKVSNEG